MNIMVIGSGGREHALAWKLRQSNLADKIFVAPGNAGTFLDPTLDNVSININDIHALSDFAKKENIGLTVVGPEAPLVAGIKDLFNQEGLLCIGPTSKAAQLEGSKAFTKDFLKRHGIPTASYKTFSQAEPAKKYIHEQGAPIVIKADGLAAGKGVILAKSEAEAFEAVEEILVKQTFGEAGKKIVIEEFLVGEEASFIVITDGEKILPMATSQDYKARDNGDQGPNTGGMGAYSPAPVVTPEIYQRILDEVIQPTIKGMAAEGYPYSGFLYAGLMITSDGTPKVLEFNCRFGDPETQPILLRLKSDLIDLCMAALENRLDLIQAEWDERTALGVVMAAGGYPKKYRTGDPITGLPTQENDFKTFHAGTKIQDEQVLTNGGRVLCVTALGETLRDAQTKAYKVVKQIKWKDNYYRTDIGYRAIKDKKFKGSV